jgi:hypothetical protein
MDYGSPVHQGQECGQHLFWSWKDPLKSAG